jgi:hypothetical protein
MMIQNLDSLVCDSFDLGVPQLTSQFGGVAILAHRICGCAGLGFAVCQESGSKNLPLAHQTRRVASHDLRPFKVDTDEV